MEINIKKNIYLKGYKSQSEMKEDILRFIMESKTDKILYKGISYEIPYKVMKKIIPDMLIIDDVMFDFKGKKSDEIKETYSNLLKEVNIKYCIYYKK